MSSVTNINQQLLQQLALSGAPGRAGPLQLGNQTITKNIPPGFALPSLNNQFAAQQLFQQQQQLAQASNPLAQLLQTISSLVSTLSGMIGQLLGGQGAVGPSTGNVPGSIGPTFGTSNCCDPQSSGRSTDSGHKGIFDRLVDRGINWLVDKASDKNSFIGKAVDKVTKFFGF